MSRGKTGRTRLPVFLLIAVPPLQFSAQSSMSDGRYNINLEHDYRIFRVPHDNFKNLSITPFSELSLNSLSANHLKMVPDMPLHPEKPTLP